MEEEIVFLLEIDENVEDSGVNMISYVNKPATQVKWEYFGEQENNFKFTDINNEKRIVTAPVMLADTKIARFSKEIGKYYVKFTKESIEKMMKKYFKEQKIHNVNLDHNPNTQQEDIYMIESYIVGDRNKSELFSDIPEGSWIASFLVENDEVWEKIKSGDFNGFSLEGAFFQKIENDYIERTYERLKTIIDGDGTDEEKESQIKELLNIK